MDKLLGNQEPGINNSFMQMIMQFLQQFQQAPNTTSGGVKPNSGITSTPSPLSGVRPPAQTSPMAVGGGFNQLGNSAFGSPSNPGAGNRPPEGVVAPTGIKPNSTHGLTNDEWHYRMQNNISLPRGFGG